MEYTTIEGVELLTVGMEWHSVSGDQTFTFEHLVDAMAAANYDPHIIAPRLKIGHTDPRFNPEGSWHNPFDEPDGAPSLGKITNLRLENEGAVLVGDFVEVPVWLAEAIPSAYPNRSIEGAYIDGSWEVETQGGKRYSFVLTGCALLGIFGPAVADLDDLERLLTEGPKEGEVSTLTQGEIAKAAVAAGAGGATLAADVDKVRGEFWRTVAVDDQYWWWPRSIWTDPNEIIADDDEGHLYRVAFSSDEEGNVTFEDPQEVRETFINVTNNEPVAARQGEPAAVFASRKDAGRDKPKPAASRPDNEEDRVDTDKAIRESLGLAEDATDAEVIAKAKELNAEETETPTTEETEPVTPSDEIPEPEAKETEEPVAASAELPDGMVAVPADQWAKVQEGAQAGAKLASDSEIKRRDDTIKLATGKGKVRPADKASLVNLHTVNREGFYTLLTAKVEDGGLVEGLVPVDERGVAGGDEEVSASAGLPDAWFPGLHKNGAERAEEVK